MIYAVVNNKGGVGKTTCAVNIGAILAREGYRTLIIDLDPQGNASSHLGIKIYALERTLRDALLGDVTIDEVTWESDFPNLYIVPSNLLLDDIETASTPGREMILRAKIRQIQDEYTYIFIDCPPRLGLFTTNALVAADKVILPIQIAYFALEGTSQILREINLIKERFDKPLLEIGHVIPMMHDARTRLGKDILRSIQTHFSEVATVPVPKAVVVDEASAHETPIVHFATNSPAADAFEKIAKELIHATT